MTRADDQLVRCEIINLLDTYCRRCTARQRKDCMQCERCDVFPEIRALGESLLTGWRGSDIEDLLDKGEEMTISDVRQLLWLGASKKDIAKAINMNASTFHGLLSKHRLRHNQLVEDGLLRPVGNNEFVGLFDLVTDK